MQVPPFRFPEIATPRVMHGTRTVLNEQFYSDRERRPQGLDEHGIYAGHEDEWRKFKLGLSARTVGPRLRAVAALNDFQPEAPSRELPPLLARRLRERQANPWREANLRDELRYNRIQETPRIPANPQARASVLARAPSQAQDLSQLQPHEQQQMPFHAQFFSASYPMPASGLHAQYPDILPPERAYELLLPSAATSGGAHRTKKARGARHRKTGGVEAHRHSAQQQSSRVNPVVSTVLSHGLPMSTVVPDVIREREGVVVGC